MERFLVAAGEEKQIVHGMTYYSVIDMSLFPEFLKCVEKYGFYCAWFDGRLKLYVDDGYCHIGSTNRFNEFLGARKMVATRICAFMRRLSESINCRWQRSNIYSKLLCDLLLHRIYVNLNNGGSYDVSMTIFGKIFKYFKKYDNQILGAALPDDVLSVVAEYRCVEDEFVAYISPLIIEFFGSEKIDLCSETEQHVVWTQFREHAKNNYFLPNTTSSN